MRSALACHGPNHQQETDRVAPVRFGYSLGVEQFGQFRFSVLTGNGFSLYLGNFNREVRCDFGSRRTVPASFLLVALSHQFVLFQAQECRSF